MQLPDMDFYILKKAFTFKFSFSLDPPNSKAIIAAKQYELGTWQEHRHWLHFPVVALAWLVVAGRWCRRGGCSATAVLENSKVATKAALT